ncbi:hypothetical protein T05_6635 [Trichinella murrelli]|uniref:Uncharacterized protein n=1 Tax=Trichinella murrelli TaxID=144512 RepID=A0A0V0TKU5_9BILA|nr:hypothetical protein T05_6635 [Trichinella murrelli]
MTPWMYGAENFVSSTEEIMYYHHHLPWRRPGRLGGGHCPRREDREQCLLNELKNDVQQELEADGEAEKEYNAAANDQSCEIGRPKQALTILLLQQRDKCKKNWWGLSG